MAMIHVEFASAQYNLYNKIFIELWIRTLVLFALTVINEADFRTNIGVRYEANSDVKISNKTRGGNKIRIK